MIRKSKYRILGNIHKGNSLELWHELGNLREGNKLLVVEIVDGIIHCIDKSKNKVELKVSDRGRKFEALQDPSELDFSFVKAQAELLMVDDIESLKEVTEKFDKKDLHSIKMVALDSNDKEWFDSIK